MRNTGNKTIKRITYLSLVLSIFLSSFVGSPFSGVVQLRADLSQFSVLPALVVVEQADLGRYDKKIDSFKVVDNNFRFETRIEEPQKVTVKFYWKGKSPVSTSFWATPDTYQIDIIDDLRLTAKGLGNGKLAKELNDLEMQPTVQWTTMRTLLKNLSNENQKIADVESRITFITDSTNKVLDEFYINFLHIHPDSPSALYALCRYAERPQSNQRFRSGPEKIKLLLNGLSASIKELPSAKMLYSKLSLSKKE